ncbi:hypothetical protein G9A89_004471 [Geosiphon pyriformis]|nr:hypothetical protein G9A89_004471 [Geosiphon pyriformis]
MGKKMGWIYNLLGDISYHLGAVIVRNQEVRIDFSEIAGRDQARKILADVEIESFLMATDGIANQIAVQIKVTGKWQLAVVEFNNQEKATRAVDQWLTLIKKDAPRRSFIS